jgi:hypothetical protein
MAQLDGGDGQPTSDLHFCLSATPSKHPVQSSQVTLGVLCPLPALRQG